MPSATVASSPEAWQAAGGVVWREHGDEVRVAVVHRPQYDDWTLPKGKPKRGERPVTTAVREVREEIGSSVAVGRRLCDIEYPFQGRPKTVAFWSMRHVDGRFSTGAEVDEVVWLSPGDARALVSYDVYRDVIDDFGSSPASQSTLVLVRHGKAGKRAEWRGDDRDRPLDHAGRRQAEQLVDLLACFAPDRIVAADRTRCVQTVEPLANTLRLPIDVVETFTDEAFVDDPEATARELLALGKPNVAVVVASQGTAIPGLIERLPLDPPVRRSTTRKGASWLLSYADPARVQADHYGSPS